MGSMITEDKLKPCPFCGGEMKIDYQNNQDYERGYYAVCDNCGIYLGLDSEAVDMGYCWGQYGSEDAVAEAWNRRVDLGQQEIKMAKKDKEFRLCYVRSNILYFTDNFEKQWGDDWNDAPYDCNAGEPYECNDDEDEDWNENHGHLRYIGIKSDGWLKVTGCFGEAYNVNYSVEEINKGAVAWLYSDEAGGLHGGATMTEAIEWCRKGKIKWGELKE